MHLAVKTGSHDAKLNLGSFSCGNFHSSYDFYLYLAGVSESCELVFE